MQLVPHLKPKCALFKYDRDIIKHDFKPVGTYPHRLQPTCSTKHHRTASGLIRAHHSCAFELLFGKPAVKSSSPVRKRIVTSFATQQGHDLVKFLGSLVFCTNVREWLGFYDTRWFLATAREQLAPKTCTKCAGFRWVTLQPVLPSVKYCTSPR